MRTRILILVVLCWSYTSLMASFESVGKIKTADVVPKQLLAGPNHKLVKTAESDGIQNRYLINTDFGQLEADGSIELRKRIREADALAHMDELSKTAVFVDALKDAGLNSAKSVVSAVRQPVQTVKGLPSGIKRVFSGYVEGAKRGVVATKQLMDSPDEVLDPQKFKERNYVVSDTERKWASELRVDPYSTNLVLRSAVSNMATLQFVGGLPLDIALPGAASLAVGIMGQIDEQVYSVNAKELEILNRTCLEKTGISRTAVDNFFNADYLTPTMQTSFCSSMSSLEDVGSLEMVADQLTHSGSFKESRFLLQTLNLLAWYHAEVEAIDSLIANKGLPYAKTGKQDLVVITPTDYLVWTEVLVSRIEHASQLAQEDQIGQKSIWLLGQASERTRQELAERDWKLRDRFNDDRMANFFQSGSTSDAAPIL